MDEATKKRILAAEKEVVDILSKHDCHLEAFATLRQGAVDLNIIVAANVAAPAAPTAPAAAEPVQTGTPEAASPMAAAADNAEAQK